MDRHKHLVALARRLSCATADRNWLELRRVDSELADVLHSLAVDGSWSEMELQALHQLHRMHSEALQCCMGEVAQLDARLAELCANKDGWMAYSLSDNWQESAP